MGHGPSLPRMAMGRQHGESEAHAAQDGESESLPAAQHAESEWWAIIMVSQSEPAMMGRRVYGYLTLPGRRPPGGGVGRAAVISPLRVAGGLRPKPRRVLMSRRSSHVADLLMSRRNHAWREEEETQATRGPKNHNGRRGRRPTRTTWQPREGAHHT